MSWGVQAACIALGAILGACLRWQMGVWFNGEGATMLWGTLLVNGIGCFLAGILLGMPVSVSWHLFLMTGFLGSLTTFSALTSEVLTLWQQGRWGNAVLVWVAHNVVGLSGVFGGYLLTRMWFK